MHHKSVALTDRQAFYTFAAPHKTGHFAVHLFALQMTQFQGKKCTDLHSLDTATMVELFKEAGAGTVMIGKEVAGNFRLNHRTVYRLAVERRLLVYNKFDEINDATSGGSALAATRIPNMTRFIPKSGD